MDDINSNILNASKTAFIDKSFNSNFLFKPTFLSNDYKKGIKVLSSLKEALSNCKEFYISVAFITESGITPLLQDLKELEKENVKGKILTTDYLYFSEPKALKRLNDLENIEVRMYNVGNDKPGLHTKGYLFKNEDYYKIIIGSSNITQNALTVNKEWNLSFSSLEEGEIARDIMTEFNSLWEVSNSLNDSLDSYERYYNQRRIILNQDNFPKAQNFNLKPNLMQKAFIKNLNKIQEYGEDKALLISATGTGKTYAAAFAIREASPKKMLFLVHREQIAKQAKDSFEKVLGSHKNFGLLSGNSKDFDADYIFSTIQMMSKPEIYEKFKENEFDYIVIDEVHRAGAPSYKRIMDYFKPKFYLGMTASPDRTDGFDIYGLFNHNIAYEIRLKQALEEDFLCPFHYFGISDDYIDGSDFNNLVSENRIKNIIEKMEYYGYSGERPKGLIFCSNKKEAKLLSEKFNAKGLKTTYLTGDNNQSERLEAINRLVSDERLDYLEYIITVDIFNEGVDIPEINQIIMLRPTESPIIFIQQLGRGLRKNNDKEYVVVLDFISNYSNNFMIPIALSGDRTYNKDNLRKYVMEGSRIIPGNSTVNFDAISKERIYESIDSTNFKNIQLFKEKYRNLKFKLGRIPFLVDFYIHGEIDPILILEHGSVKTYHKFLSKYEEEYTTSLRDIEVDILEFISANIANGKRPHEAVILKKLISNLSFTIKEVSSELESNYHIINNEKSIKSALNILNFEFNSKDKKKFNDFRFFDNNYNISSQFKELLKNNEFKKLLADTLDFSLLKYNQEYLDNYSETNLVLYKKYTRKDVCRILNWTQDESSTMYGYKLKHNTCPIFVTYHKSEDISKSTDYQDEFIDYELFSWMSRSNRTLKSNELQPLIYYNKSNLDVHLFIKKSDDEGKDFYYMGKVYPVESRETSILNDNGETLPIVNFKLKLDHIAREDIFSYFEDLLIKYK